MGTAMAKNLVAAGHGVIACVRRPEQMGALLALGLKPTSDLADLFGCEVVISMLPDDEAVREVALGRQERKGLAAGLRPGAIHLSMSTISTAAASQLASVHARCGHGYVAAPVFGNPDAAKARQLFIIAAGAQVDVERCRPLLDLLGQQAFVVGSDPAHANLIKLMGNMLTATALEMLGETVALIRKRGLDPGRFVEVLTSTMFGGRVHRIYGERIVAQDYAAGFALPLVLKDVGLALAEAGKRGRADAVGERGARPIDDRNRARLRGAGLDRARPDRRRRGRRTDIALRGAVSEARIAPNGAPARSPQDRGKAGQVAAIAAKPTRSP
jgi:3-hydroxyisobutyrate dehydrogenase-like beta-hydroxyacid dehydrogenase